MRTREGGQCVVCMASADGEPAHRSDPRFCVRPLTGGKGLGAGKRTGGPGHPRLSWHQLGNLCLSLETIQKP